MESTRLLRDSTRGHNGSGAVLVAGDFSQDVRSQLHNDETQKDGLKIRADAHGALKHHGPAGYGLPCANCKAYYASDLPSCPICKCAERVPATWAVLKSPKMLEKSSGGVLQRSFMNSSPTPACSQRRQVAVDGDKEAQRFRWESKLLPCADTEEINAGASLSCILDENHNTQRESASVCLSYDQLREKLARTEAALAMDLRQAARVIYEAVWAGPSPMEASRTYQNAAEALLDELRHRACMVGY